MQKGAAMPESVSTYGLGDLYREMCAVLVIDEGGLAEELDPRLVDMVSRTARICAAAREVCVPVIFACDAHIPGLDRELLVWGDHCRAGTPSSKPVPELGFCEKDYYIPKRRYSAFFQTGLRLLLDELGVSTLIVCGFDTNICVRHTLADAFYNNYDTVVVSDATATFLVGTQENGLAEIKVCYGSAIVETEEVLAFLAKEE